MGELTRANVSFVVNRLSQLLHKIPDTYWHASLRVLRYLVTTKDVQLQLGSNINLCGYSDLDWTEDRFDF